MWQACLLGLFASVIALIVSRFGFGGGRLSYKLLAIELFHLGCYFAGQDVGIREHQLPQNVDELILLFASLLCIAIVLRVVGFVGFKDTPDGLQRVENQFGIRDIMVIMFSVVLFLVIAKPNEIRFREWWNEAIQLRLILPMLLVVLTGLFCGYSRLPWTVKLFMISFGIIAGVCLAFYLQNVLWLATMRQGTRGILELWLWLSSMGIMTWLLVIPFSHQGWRIAFSNRLAFVSNP